MKVKPAEMALELGLMVHSKEQWIKTFSSGEGARPQWEVDQKKRELKILEQARDAYTTLADKG
jgi:hypothetical protein